MVLGVWQPCMITNKYTYVDSPQDYACLFTIIWLIESINWIQKVIDIDDWMNDW